MSLDTTSCILQGTTDEQLNYNLSELVKLLVEALQSGDLPVANSNKLQNLSIDDIINLAKENINIPDLYNTIITNDDNSVTNIIESITSYNIIKDTKFIQSDYIKYKIINKNVGERTDVKHISFNLPIDLINKEKIVGIYLTPKTDTVNGYLTNFNLFDYDIGIDPTDINASYLVHAEATDLKLGDTQLYNIDNLPNDPGEWGEFSKETFIKVTYLVDSNWEPNKNIATEEVIPGIYDIAKSTITNPIPMNYGINSITTPNDGITRVINEPVRMISNIQGDTVKYEPNQTHLNEPVRMITKDGNQLSDGNVPYNVYHLPTWMVFNKNSESIIFNNNLDIINDQHSIILQDGFETIKNMIDNIRDFQADYDTDEAGELNNVFIMPPNKIIEQLLSDSISLPSLKSLNLFDRIIEQFGNSEINLQSQTINDHAQNMVIEQGTQEEIALPRKTQTQDGSNRIIEQMVKNLIDLKVSGELNEHLSDAHNDSTLILLLSTDNDSPIRYHKYYVPDRIIEEIALEIISWNTQTTFNKESPAIVLFSDLMNITFNFTKMINDPTRVINILNSINLRIQAYYTLIMDPDRNIEQSDTESIVYREQTNIINDSDRPVSQEEIEAIDYKQRNNLIKSIEYVIEMIQETKIVFREYGNIVKHMDAIILQFETSKIVFRETGTFITETEKQILQNKEIIKTNPITHYTEEKLLSNNPYHICNVMIKENVELIQQLAVVPAIMMVSSGSVSYLENLQNIKVVSSLLAKNDYYSLYTGDGKQQRSVYEFQANQDQRVFDVKSNIYDTTVYREGFRLSKGDYYTNGSKVILKRPANAGENITIVSEKKYTYSDTVTQEDLENALKQLKAIDPIISYQTSVYELTCPTIKIENYDSLATYNISIKFDGSYREDISYIRNGNLIYLDIPEVFNVRRKVMEVTITSILTGRMQSSPVTANIIIKNLYDYTDTSDLNRIVIGADYDKWIGQTVTSYNFDDIKTSFSNIETIPEDTSPKRIGIEKDDWLQSKVLSGTFTGTYIDSYIGLENIANRSLSVVNGTTTETVLNLNGFSIGDLEEAYTNDRLWFIIDSSTGSSLNTEYLNAVNLDTGINFGNTGKYAYRNAKELIGSLNILPRTDDTVYLEHNDKLKNRIVKTVMILDLELKIDFDFEDTAMISENGLVTKNDITMDSIEYLTQDEIPHLLIKITNDQILTSNNPYINESSKVILPLDVESLNTKQEELDDSGFSINNIYNERTFGGNVTSQYNSEDSIMSELGTFKKFDFSFSDSFKNDFFVLSENQDEKLNLGLVRFHTDEQVIKEVIIPESTIKVFQPITSKEKSIKSLVKRPQKYWESSNEYVNDISVMQFGGYTSYLDDTNQSVKVVDTTISYTDLYIRDAFDITSSKVPLGVSDLTDDYHVKYSIQYTSRMPTIWDTVYKPSTRTIKNNELRLLFKLISEDVDLTDQRWLNITDGLLENGSYSTDGRITEVINTETENGFLIFGGVGYKPSNQRLIGEPINSYIISQKLSDDPTNQNILNLETAFNHIDTTWKDRTDIINIEYGWENNEPYIDYHWVKTWTVSDMVDEELVLSYKMNYFVNRVSRIKSLNTDIYQINTSVIDSAYKIDDSIFSGSNDIVMKHTYDEFTELFKDGDDIGTDETQRLIFHDIVHESNVYWLTIKPYGTEKLKLYKLDLTLGVFQELVELTENKWSLVKDIASNIRGDGPIMIKHTKDSDILEDSGIYYYDTWDNKVYNKKYLDILETSNIFGIPEIDNVRNPYLLRIDTAGLLNDRIDIVGNVLFVIIYLDRYLASLTIDEINEFKKEIIHLNNGMTASGKIVRVLPNEFTVGIKTIIPADDDFRSNSAQIIFSRHQTSTGRTANNLVFRLTQLDQRKLEIDSLRFVSS